MSEQTRNQLTYPVDLDSKHRGHLAEFAFMRKAASLGFAVAQPYGESERYDLVVRVQNIFWRVQVKSVLARTPSRRYYRVKTSVGGGSRGPATTYSTTEIDFLAAYIFQEDLWYIFPAAVIEGRTCVCLAPGSKRSKYEKYCEAWKLMNPAITVVEPGPASKLDGDSGSAFAETFTAAAAIAPGA